MPLVELLASLEREAEANAAEQLKRARAEADRLLQVASGEEKAQVEEHLAQHALALRAVGAERLVLARRKAATAVLEARRKLLDRVFQGARTLQPEARGWASYQPALERDVHTLLALTAGEEVTLLCNSADCPSVLAAAGPGKRVEASLGVVAGVRLRSADGRLEVDRSLDGRLAAGRAQLAIRVMQQVEGGR